MIRHGKQLCQSFLCPRQGDLNSGDKLNHSGGAAPLLHCRQRQRRCSDAASRPVGPGDETVAVILTRPARLHQSGASDATGRVAAEQRLRCG